MWQKFRKEIQKNIDTKGLENFLSWPIINKTMKADDEPHIALLDFFEEKMISFSNLNNIFEFGAGHGRVCRLIKERNFFKKHNKNNTLRSTILVMFN